MENFYRIIMPAVIRECRLVLPKKFVDGYGHELSKTIKLSLPVGASWYIGLKQHGDMLCLDDGWENFMKHYLIRFGYFLLFKYRRNSEFDLHIFDLTATEIQYPLGCYSEIQSHVNKHAVVEERCLGVPKKEDDDGSIPETLVASSRIRLSKRKYLAESPTLMGPRKMQKVIPTCNKLHQRNASASEHASASSDGFNLSTCPSKSVRLPSKHDLEEKPILDRVGDRALHAAISTSPSKSVRLPPKHDSEEKSISDRVGDRALHAATMYRTDNPSFIVKLKDYNVKQYTFNLPTQFSRDHMNGHSEFIELLDSDNKKWLARGIKNGTQVRVGKGWSQFVKEKHLKTGDVCVVELIHTNVTLKVTIFHAKRRLK